MPTVAELIEQVRQRADMQDTEFVTDDEIVGFLNQANQDAYLAVVSADEGYFVEEAALNINAELVALPDDCFKVVGVDALYNGKWLTLRRFNFNDRNRYKSQPSQWRVDLGRFRFSVQKNSLRFMPVPESAFTGKLYYIPYTPSLTIGGDLDFPIAQWDCYLINSAAAVCVAKEQGDPSFWLREADQAMKQIIATVAHRVTSEPLTVTDVYRQNYDSLEEW